MKVKILRDTVIGVDKVGYKDQVLDLDKDTANSLFHARAARPADEDEVVSKPKQAQAKK